VTVDLAALAIADPKVGNPESLSVRVEFEHPDHDALATTFSTTIYFHPDEASGFAAYGEQAHFALLASVADAAADAEVVPAGPADGFEDEVVIMARYVSVD